MRTQNHFITSRRFLAAAAWVERGGPISVLPGLWLEAGVDVGVDARLTRVTFSWLRWRLQVDIGRWHGRAAWRVLDWKKDGLDAFLAWAGETFGGAGAEAWPRAWLEDLLQREESLHRLICLGGEPSHYTRVMLAREIMARHEIGLAGSLDISSRASEAASG